MISRLLVAVDGSPRAPGVFAAAIEIAMRFGAVVHPFRAIFVPPEFPAAAAGSQRDRLPEHLSQEAHADILRLTAGTAPGTVAAPIVRVGSPGKLIVQLAEELDVDLIVVGSHGYEGWDRILGTTAARVANLARRNVLVVHDRGDSPPSVSAPTIAPYR